VNALLHATGAAIAGAGVHALVLDTAPYDVTGEAIPILEQFFGPRAAGRPLPARVGAWLDAEQERRRDRSLESRARIDAPLVGENGPDRLLVTLVSGVTDFDVLVLHRRESVPSIERLESFSMSRREAEVLQLVIAGETNASIAAALFISAGTVKKHLDNVYRKLGVGNRAAAVATVLDLWANTP
jgi:DNA-binding CsgD family transcriptional regulator